MDKIFVSAGQLLADSFRLAARIYVSGFRPQVIAGVWRGGAPVAVAVQEYFEYQGIEMLHFPVKTASYTGIDERARTIEVSLPEALIGTLRPDAALLIVDDVVDTGLSLLELRSRLREEAGDRLPGDIRVACPWYKPGRNRTGRAPDYFLHETESWIVFPHELAGLTADEIRAGKTDLAAVIEELGLK